MFKDKTLMITKYKDWSGLLEYTGNTAQGEYYTVEPQKIVCECCGQLLVDFKSIKI